MRNGRQKLFFQTTRFLCLFSGLTLSVQQLRTLDFGVNGGGDVHRHTAHSDRTTLVANNNGLGLDPDVAPVFAQPTKPARATLARLEDRRRFARRSFLVFGMNDREPEIRRRQPLFLAVAEQLLNVTTDEVDPLTGDVR